MAHFLPLLKWLFGRKTKQFSFDLPTASIPGPPRASLLVGKCIAVLRNDDAWVVGAILLRLAVDVADHGYLVTVAGEELLE